MISCAAPHIKLFTFTFTLTPPLSELLHGSVLAPLDTVRTVIPQALFDQAEDRMQRSEEGGGPTALRGLHMPGTTHGLVPN